MLRPLMLATLLVTSAPAFARIGPEVAYATATEVYLINPDGTGKVRLYRSKSNDFISTIALKPGGGLIAIVENWKLKFIEYNAAGQVTGTVRTVAPTCSRLADVHFHPNGGSVLYWELCPTNKIVKSVAVPTSAAPNPTPTTLFSDPNLQDLGPWEPAANSFLYATVASDHMELRRHYTDGTADPSAAIYSSVIGTAEQVRYPDVSSDGARILIASSPEAAAYPGPGFTSEIDAATGAVLRPNFITGRRANYASDGVRAAFVFANSYNDQYLRYRDGTGQIRQIAGRNHYSAVDWGD